MLSTASTLSRVISAPARYETCVLLARALQYRSLRCHEGSLRRRRRVEDAVGDAVVRAGRTENTGADCGRICVDVWPRPIATVCSDWTIADRGLSPTACALSEVALRTDVGDLGPRSLDLLVRCKR